MLVRERECAAPQRKNVADATELVPHDAADMVRKPVPPEGLGTAWAIAMPLHGPLGILDRGDREREEPLGPWADDLRQSWAAAGEERQREALSVPEGARFEVFNDVVVGTSPVYTGPEHDDALGAMEKIAIQAVVSQVSFVMIGGITFTVSLEHSQDRLNWSAKYAAPAINGVPLATSSTNVIFGFDGGSTPSLRFVRARISIAASLPSARVALYVRLRPK